MSAQSDQTLSEIFRAVFNRPSGADVTRIRQLTDPAWDSLAHVSLIGAVESQFGVSIDTSDSLELTSFEAIRLFIEERLA